VLRSSYVYRPTRQSKLKTFHKLSKYNKPGENIFLVHSSRRGVVHFPALSTTLLTLTLRHSKFKTNNAALHSNTSLQSSIPLKTASLPGLIVVNKSSAVISQQTSLLTNSGINIDMSLTQISDPEFCHIINQCIKLQVFCRCKFYNKEHRVTYNEKPNSFCGMVLKYCNIIANEA
jgi:hypothetical protein